VRYDFDKQPEYFGNSTNRSTRNSAEYASRIIGLRADAAEVLHALFSFNTANHNPEERPIPAYSVIIQMLDAFDGRRDMLAEILCGLAIDGRVTLRSRGDPRLPFMNRLLETGLVTRASTNTGGRFTYQVAPRFRQAFRALG
jgi:hypothetical protein